MVDDGWEVAEELESDSVGSGGVFGVVVEGGVVLGFGEWAVVRLRFVVVEVWGVGIVEGVVEELGVEAVVVPCSFLAGWRVMGGGCVGGGGDEEPFEELALGWW